MKLKRTFYEFQTEIVIAKLYFKRLKLDDRKKLNIK